jgi:bla regulator protein BlaR1
MLGRGLTVGVLIFTLCCGVVAAQSTGLPGRKFEVVSIREGPSTHMIEPGGVTPDGYRWKGMPLFLLVLTAYLPESTEFTRYDPDTIQGMPRWAADNGFDIDARISDADRADWQDPKKQPAMLREMLQAVLADRFKIVLHREMKEMPVYDLVVAKGGPKFQEAKAEASHPDATAVPNNGGFIGRGGGGVMRYYDVPMKSLTMMLSGVWTGRHVLDRTELTGRYDINLPQFIVGGISPAEDNSATSNSPSVFSALGALGLKLRPDKGQVEMLVIDRIEEPTAN